MSKMTSKKPLAVALGAAFLLSTAATQASVFQTADLGSGYQVAGEGKCGEGKCGEGKCGEKKDGEGKCGEGKCGEKK
tara:strand:+ start:6454 stop:6684 length:231 start_codon:yes stop_codon:yes gene_type:complete